MLGCYLTKVPLGLVRYDSSEGFARNLSGPCHKGCATADRCRTDDRSDQGSETARNQARTEARAHSQANERPDT